MILQLRRFTSQLLLLLFMLMMGGEYIVEYLCDCHSEHVTRHECCSCPSHQDECENHNEFATHKCHSDVVNLVLNEAIVVSEKGVNLNIEKRLQTNALIADLKHIIEKSTKTSELSSPQNIICNSQCCTLSSALRAPPVYV